MNDGPTVHLSISIRDASGCVHNFATQKQCLDIDPDAEISLQDLGIVFGVALNAMLPFLFFLNEQHAREELLNALAGAADLPWLD